MIKTSVRIERIEMIARIKRNEKMERIVTSTQRISMI